MSKILYYLLIRIFHRTRKWKIPIKTKNILIVRPDAIGDYILFRNFIQTLKESDKFKHHKFTLLGNVVYKDLAEHFDNKYISNFIWFNPNEFKLRNLENLKLHFRLKLKAFDYLIQPVHSKTKNIEDFLLDLGAKIKVCSPGDTVNLKNVEELYLINARYDRVIECSDARYFEFERNQDFISNLITPEKIITQLSFKIEKAKKTNKQKKILLFPGASVDYRKWSNRNFSKLASSLYKNYDVEFIIAGSKQDNIAAEEIYRLAPDVKFSNITGKTSLVELVYLINEIDLLISNETSAVHIAAATDTPTICISNGNHFGRFNPYPIHFEKKIVTIYPNDAFYKVSEFDKLYNQNKQISKLDINNISSDVVYKVIHKHFKEILSV